MNLAQAKQKEKQEEMRMNKANKKKGKKGKADIVVAMIGPSEDKDSLVLTVCRLDKEAIKETIKKIQAN